MDNIIIEYLVRVYACKVKKVGAYTSSITSKRRKRVKTGKMILGFIPKYRLEVWEEELTDWKKSELFLWKGDKVVNGNRNVYIYTCRDEYNDIIYWKYLG